MHRFRKKKAGRNPHSISTSLVMTGIWETFATSSSFHSKDHTHLSAVGWVPLGTGPWLIHPTNPERHTYIISQGCCTMENGHGALLLIVVEFFMNLEENQSSMSSPAGKASQTLQILALLWTESGLSTILKSCVQINPKDGRDACAMHQWLPGVKGQEYPQRE